MLLNLLKSLVRRNDGPALATVQPWSAERFASIEGRLEDVCRSLSRIDDWGALNYQAQSLLVRQQILSAHCYDDPRRLDRQGIKIYSQNDEDGLISEIFKRVGTENRSFLEFGVENGLENNTRFLLEQGWSGTWLEGDSRFVAAMEQGFRARIESGRLRVVHAMVDRENINELIRASGLPNDLDLLSIDIDGNDYHIWESITVIEPRIVVIEYNAKFPPPVKWLMPYDPAFRWDGSDQFGASIASMAELGQRKGYQLVGCNITGANAFFVRTDVAKDLFYPPDVAALYHPPRYFLTAGFVSGHPPAYPRIGA